jgi:hypothetical protein
MKSIKAKKINDAVLFDQNAGFVATSVKAFLQDRTKQFMQKKMTFEKAFEAAVTSLTGEMQSFAETVRDEVKGVCMKENMKSPQMMN